MDSPAHVLDSIEWFTDTEQHAWRTFLRTSILFLNHVETDISKSYKISLADYEILVNLSEHPERKMRMTDLANSIIMSPSNLTYRTRQLEKAGYIRREQCGSDGRSCFAVLTDEGFERMQEIAPQHVNTVRKHFLDPLTEKDIEVLSQIMKKILWSMED